jgi:hypothetical protein
MCGLAGFSGVDISKTAELAYLLGVLIDDRGGHAAGYLTTHAERKPRVGRILGKWQDARERFILEASTGDVTALHSRFATCGGRTVREAHPFTIKRNGSPVLWGMHNGVLYNAGESARKNNRTLNVDSAEMFELLADKDLDGLRALQGYGAIAYATAEHGGQVNLAKLSDDGALYVCALKEGGTVWGSTKEIVLDGLEWCDLHIKHPYKLDTGRVYSVKGGAIYQTDLDGVTVAQHTWSASDYTGKYAWPAWLKGTDNARGWDAWDDDELSALANSLDRDDTSEDDYSEDELDDMRERELMGEALDEDELQALARRDKRLDALNDDARDRAAEERLDTLWEEAREERDLS